MNLFIYSWIPFILLVACGDSKKSHPRIIQKAVLQSPTPDDLAIFNSKKPSQWDTTLQTLEIGGHLTDILPPKGAFKGNIIVLPGWSFSRKDWCEKASLCKKATEKGYRLIMPEMGKSVYASQFYPETLKDWQKYPNKAWLINELIPTLQKEHGILLPEQHNFVVGLSTGGRGVALMALAKPELFKAVAALSGDFDQTQMPTDRLIIGYYGSYQAFKSRWEGEDNPTKQAARFKTPIYLGHGKQDNIVPVSQTQIFYDALQKANPALKIKLNLVNAAHDYAYWESETENVLNFFGEFE
jgi:predicted esterase